MKKDVILNEIFGSRVVSYDVVTPSILIIELEQFEWSDLTPEIIKSFIDIQSCTENTIKLAIEYDD